MLNIGVNNPNFKSTPIQNVHLRNAQGGYVKAVFTELDQKNIEDIEGIRNISTLWKNADYGKTYCKHFLTSNIDNNVRYFSLEFEHGKNLAERILGLLKLRFSKNLNTGKMDISLLQTKPEIMYTDYEQNRAIKGVGETLLSAAFVLAKNKKISRIDIVSTNDYFYYNSFKKAGLDLNEEDKMYYNIGDIEIHNKDFDKYIDYINKKYTPKQ